METMFISIHGYQVHINIINILLDQSQTNMEPVNCH